MINQNILREQVKRIKWEEVFGVSNIVVINNMIDEERTRELSGTKEYVESNKINLITVARFHQQKRLDRLIKAYAKLKNYYTLTIIGDGELKEELINLSKQLGVFNEINWKGIMENPYPLIKESDLFVMSFFMKFISFTVFRVLTQSPAAHRHRRSCRVYPGGCSQRPPACSRGRCSSRTPRYSGKGRWNRCGTG